MKMLIMLLIFLCIAFIGYLYRENHRFVITRYQLTSAKLNGLEEPVKIAVLTDLHNHQYGKENEKLIAALEKEHPDAVLVAGDLIIAKPGRETKDALELMKKVAAKYPVYYANGNHEYRMKIYTEVYGETYQTYKAELNKCGVVLLENEHASITLKGQKFEIFGLEIEREYYKRFVKRKLPESYLEDRLGNAKDGQFKILLAHNPLYFDAYQNWGADLTLSGHIHGGIVNLPFFGGLASPQIELFPKYDAGLFKKHGRYMVQSRGLGTHTINVRINNPAELVAITLQAKVESICPP